jgi:protein O-GlcNAc transferase
MSLSLDDALRMAADAIAADELTWAEALIRGVLDKTPEDPRAQQLLNDLAARIGVPRIHDAETDRPRFLLIKSWGKGFWSDVDHVLGALLAAEMTRRTPVIHWGPNNLFTAPGIKNAWDQFFEPVNSLQLSDVVGDRLTYFPPKWSAKNLDEENLNLWQGPGSRVTGLALLNRPEDVVVADFHVPVAGLIPWIEPCSPHRGRSPHEIYRYLFERYARPKTRMRAEVDAFHTRHLAGKPYVAVHWRGSDKYEEQRALRQINAQYFEHVDRLAADPAWRIFLLTDDAGAAAAFRQRYGDRLVLAEAERSSDAVGVHGKPGDGPRRGMEVMRDTYLAARADRFIGNGASNVSAAVVHLKNWADADLVLLAPIRQYRTVPVLYRPR